MADDAKQRMNAKAAELAALVKAGHKTHVGAENSIAAYAESLEPGHAAAWRLYDYGVAQFLQHSRKGGGQ